MPILFFMIYLILMTVPRAKADQHFVGPEMYKILEPLCKKKNTKLFFCKFYINPWQCEHTPRDCPRAFEKLMQTKGPETSASLVTG